MAEFWRGNYGDKHTFSKLLKHASFMKQLAGSTFHTKNGHHEVKSFKFQCALQSVVRPSKKISGNQPEHFEHMFSSTSYLEVTQFFISLCSFHVKCHNTL